MKRAIEAAVVVLIAALIACPVRSSAAVLQETGRIALPAVTGRIDHLAVDVASKRLFVAAFGNATVEVIDLEAKAVLRSLRGFHEPQGVLFISAPDRLLVSDGGADHVTILDTNAFASVGNVPLPEDSDNMRVEPSTGRAWVGAGSGRSSALVEIDPVSGVVLATIALDGHPEAFQFEQHGSRVFVNVPTTNSIQVLDRQERRTIATWPVPTGVNFPMTIDERSHRLFIATRSPARLAVYDVSSGRIVATIPIAGDADDLFYDMETRRIYASGGEGSVEVIQQDGPDRYNVMENVRTRTGARTSLFVAEWRKLFVAVPGEGKASAEIRVFDVAH